ncbi:hypothetical protein PR003_g2912 [Phytophthora rubi]|uniref:Uncharacterized protein n=1 Tax=Phytophthora rubi TaxID=129364 RepID=A0A6A3NMV8_9STRA|nr:hypothetical protein PR002_g1401 [Phytophthora rubi]KAE9050031.1 hypothetical protein PR001_g2767 [Phytophthora rubi]KAE9355307.1 hypothetical protein PR003_g2912 [Phytophthora rubi]
MYAKKIAKTLVIPGGLMSYLQTVDSGILKSFKDSSSGVINEWKTSNRVTYTLGGNPRAPDIDEVVDLMGSTWYGFHGGVVERSVSAAGFTGNYEKLNISKHDAYGSLF